PTPKMTLILPLPSRLKSDAIALQARAEFVALREFVVLADRVGLPIPGDSQIFREPVEPTELYDDWPSQEIWQILAVAQHHGVPTRLLDFSFDSNTAAFFAALGMTADSPCDIAERCRIVHSLGGRSKICPLGPRISK
ncbi:MAG: FRG domain-containing protein, partial [Chloroflexi bacterium]|nr:FRG domain-containing protein [Chloroflexota bacterium]